MSEWYPIETAPRDGTWVLVSYLAPSRGRARIVEEAVYVEEYGGWGNNHCWDLGADAISNVTHWMPRPADPTKMVQDPAPPLPESER